MITAPPSVTALPPAPDTQNEAEFESTADTFLSALPTFRTGMQGLAQNAFDNATEAAGLAAIAGQQAGLAEQAKAAAIDLVQAAQATSGVAMWASGNYATGTVVWSPADGQMYRRRTPGGASPVDPSTAEDAWYPLSPKLTAPVYMVSASLSIPVGTRAGVYVLTAPNLTLTLPATSRAGDAIRVLDRSGADAPGHVINPNGANLEAQTQSAAWDIKGGEATFLQSGASRGWLVFK